MGEASSDVEGEQDWRLQAELDSNDPRHSLHELVGHFRGPDVAEQARASMPHDVVLTHDGRLLFAYAADEATLETARNALETALQSDGIHATIRVSHWDHELDDWRQTDPPLATRQKHAQEAADRDAERPQTQTLVASSGKMIRAEFEQTMLDWASKLGVQCKIIEHPHLLTTQVAFTVTGPKRKVEEFSQGLTAEERATIRTETRVMASPL